MSERFYINSPLGPGKIRLEGPEAHHLGTVCRVRPGDAVCLFNGDGRQYPARVLAAGRKEVQLEIVEVETAKTELPFRLEVAVPLPKGDRAQFLVEKLTELGVTTFVPLQTSRSVVHPREGKMEKLQRYVIEASKQCGRNVLMKVEPPRPWMDYVKSDPPASLKVVAQVGAEAGTPAATTEMIVAVGPEGGFTNEEIETARQRGWQITGLGPRVLRVETAAILLTAWAIRQTSNLASATP
jgi:16S rRNA (uracil1498-N3)-methyltransferase